MKQVLSNLIVNAIQHMERFGTLTIGNEDLGSEVRFYVSDDGDGIDAEEKDKIFDLYWQGSHHEGTGTGMGLSIAKTLVEAHGGRIWVDSEPGRGSTFQFTIPRGRSLGQMNA
jgi:signal transduction histidine kinase